MERKPVLRISWVGSLKHNTVILTQRFCFQGFLVETWDSASDRRLWLRASLRGSARMYSSGTCMYFKSGSLQYYFTSISRWSLSFSLSLSISISLSSFFSHSFFISLKSSLPPFSSLSSLSLSLYLSIYISFSLSISLTLILSLSLSFSCPSRLKSMVCITTHYFYAFFLSLTPFTLTLS